MKLFVLCVFVLVLCVLTLNPNWTNKLFLGAYLKVSVFMLFFLVLLYNFNRGADDYLPGNIVEIEIRNFMTFNHLVCKPGSRLNLVIGPNGSGKSSLVCAIALGLGGEPQVINATLYFHDFVVFQQLLTLWFFCSFLEGLRLLVHLSSVERNLVILKLR